jgi:UDP-N-acetylmuramyl-tripeptide synthetase
MDSMQLMAAPRAVTPADGIEPMRLQHLLDAAGAHVQLLQGDAGQPISALRSDSRHVVAGCLFVGLAGSARNGASFAADAIRAGATAVLLHTNEARNMAVPQGVALLASDEPRLALALMAATLYAPQPAHVVAVTGTDGKTSTTDFARQLLDACGMKAASLGTIGARSDSLNITLEATHTTPDPITLHQQLRQLANAGAECVAMEASSHGLHQYRMDGVQLSAAAFTNLGRDHMDYHITDDAYYLAKRRLFDAVLPSGAVASIYADDARSADLRTVCEARGHVVVDFGRMAHALRLLASEPVPEGLRITLAIMGEEIAPITLPLMGGFQALNALAAVGLAAGCLQAPIAESLHRLVALLPSLKGVRGRMEHVGTTASGAGVIVDYAHTPRALETVLQALRPHTRGALHVVFGCGGDRDRGNYSCRSDGGLPQCAVDRRAHTGN